MVVCRFINWCWINFIPYISQKNYISRANFYPWKSNCTWQNYWLLYSRTIWHCRFNKWQKINQFLAVFLLAKSFKMRLSIRSMRENEKKLSKNLLHIVHIFYAHKSSSIKQLKCSKNVVILNSNCFSHSRDINSFNKQCPSYKQNVTVRYIQLKTNSISYLINRVPTRLRKTKVNYFAFIHKLKWATVIVSVFTGVWE